MDSLVAAYALNAIMDGRAQMPWDLLELGVPWDVLWRMRLEERPGGVLRLVVG